MCGITGIWHKDDSPIDRHQMEQFTHSLEHRGPDGQNCYFTANRSLALGNRRLAIVDSHQRGNQPMAYAEQRYWLTFNGEIYNFVELRAELQREGYSFTTQTDSEVILAAYIHWGAGCQQRFNGMWAFAIWDSLEQILFLSRDRFGVKPLYVYDDGKRFAFASEVKAFLALAWSNVEFNFNYLAGSLATDHYRHAAQETILQSVKRVPAGHQLLIRPAKSPILTRWWNTLDHIQQVPKNFDEQILAFRELFDDACRIRLRCDAPIAVSLSGGLDSTSVLASLYQVDIRGERRWSKSNYPKAYVATFNDPTRDERHLARHLIDALNVPTCYENVRSRVTTDALDKMLFYTEDANSIHFANWTIYEAMQRDKIPVAMTGDGSDELFVAYPTHIQAALLETVHFMPDFRRFLEIRHIQQAILPESYRDRPMRKTQKIFEMWLSFRSLRATANQIHDPTIASNLNGSNLIRMSPANVDHAAFHEDGQRFPRERVLAKRLYFDFHYGILPWILHIKDMISMAHGVEIRSPFMDWRIVCFALSLPSSSVIGKGFTKRLLREAMPGRLPEPLRTRTSKISFADSEQSLFWQLKPIVQETIHSADFLESPLWDGRELQKVIEDRYRTGNMESSAFLWKCVKTARLIHTFSQTRKHDVQPT